MIGLDEDALICDLAEVYHIFNYKDLPLQTVATLACGLGERSRIYRKMSDCDYDLETILMSKIYDVLQIILYSKTKDSKRGINKPEMLTERLLSKNKKKDDGEFMVFDTPEAYEEYMRKKRGVVNV